MPVTFENRIDESLHITITLLAKELKKRKHEVVIISSGHKKLPSKETFQGIDVHRGKVISRYISINRMLSPILKIKNLEKGGEKFDVVHTFSAARFFAFQPLLTKLFMKNKDIKTVHTIKSYSKFKIGNRMTRILNLADKVTVPTETFGKELIKYGCKKKKLKIIKSPIDLKKFFPKKKSESKKKVGIKNKFMLYYGGISENKGFKVLIKSAKKILKHEKNTKLVIILRKQNLSKYKKLIDEIKKIENIILINKVIDNIEDYVNAADIVLLPYKNLIATEGNPSCLLEAMSCKTPIITTDVPELKDIVKHNNQVLMAKSGSVESFVKQVKRALDNKKLQQKLVKNAYTKVKEFDVIKITEQFINLYKSLSEKK